MVINEMTLDCGMIDFLPIGILMVLGYSKMAHGVWYPSLWKYIV